MTERYLSAKDIQLVLGVSRTTAYDVLSQCTCVKFGANVRVAESAFQRWLDHHKVMPIPPRSLLAHRAKREYYSHELLKDENVKPIRLTRPRD